MTFLSHAELSVDERANYGFERAKDLAFDAVLSLWKKRSDQGLKKNQVAEGLGRSPAWVTRVLRGPANWTLRTFGELVEVLDGEIEIIVHDLKDCRRPTSNYEAYAEYAQTVDFIYPYFATANPVPMSGTGFFNSPNLLSSAVSK